MMGENNGGPIIQESVSSGISTNDFLVKVFFRMFLGLLATAVIATYTFYSGLLEDIAESGAYIGFFIAEIVVVLVFSLGFRKLSAGVVNVLFYAYAALTGVTFSAIFVAFDLQSIAYAFFGAAAIFGVMAYIGKNTTKDLTKLGTILMVALIVGVIVSLINLFVGNAFIDIILDWVMLAVFTGFTAYDIQKISNLQGTDYADSDKLYVYGAMELYLDFINLFIRLLSIINRYRKN